jgi:polyphosphate kinase
LREAALDPKVTSIKLHYIDWLRILRLLVRSSMLPKNGKKVTVQIELHRFDEASNISCRANAVRRN